MKNVSRIKTSLRPDQIRPYAMDKGTTLNTLDKLGISFDGKALKELMSLAGVKGSGMDAAPNMITTASVTTPIQFLQYWLPESITVVTTKRDIDELVGRDFAGTWFDEEIVQTLIERTGRATPYGDKANPNMASYNVNLESRTIVRFEEGVEVGVLEEGRAAAMRLNSAQIKREAAAESLENERNLVGYYGYADGTNKTYGLLNDPNLPNYITVAQGASGGTGWETKTFQEIQNDIILGISGIQVTSGNHYNPTRDKAVLAIALNKFQYLNKQNEYGKSVMQWLRETYPLIDVLATPFFDGANGGANVFYLWAVRINGKPVISQHPVEVLRLLGVWNKGKNFEEFYSNATAGVFVKQPIGTYRATGI